MPASKTTEKQPAPRTCKRCGQPINTLTDSWEMQHTDDGKYATGIQHVTCPISPEIQDLPPSPPFLNREGAALALRVASAAPGVGPSTPATTPTYLTMDEAAKLIRVSKDTIRNRIRAGLLPALRLKGGQTVLIDQRDVLALLEPVGPAEVQP